MKDDGGKVMKTLLSWGAAIAAVVSVVLGAGCKSEDQDRVVEQGRHAFESAKSSLSDAFASLERQWQKLDLHSSSDALAAAHDKAVELEKQLANVKAPSSVQSLHLEAVKAQIDRLEAAITVQKLQAEWDAAVKKAAEGKDLAQEKIAETSKTLRDADANFKALDDKLSAAKKAYQTAADKVSETLGKGAPSGK